jgi:hypothetical protein
MPAARLIGGGVAGLLIAAFALWAALYFSGALPWLGYAWLARQSFGAGPVRIVGETSAGTSFGLESFVFIEGQEIVVDYDAEIHAGSLWFYVYRPLDAELGAGTSHYVTESGAGVWTYRVPRTGFYTITIEPSTARGNGRGFDLSYSVWWGARPAR